MTSFKPNLSIKEQAIVTCEGRAVCSHDTSGRSKSIRYPYKNVALSICQGDLLFYYGHISSKRMPTSLKDFKHGSSSQIASRVHASSSRSRRNTNAIFSMFNGLDINMEVHFAGVARTANLHGSPEDRMVSYWKRGLTSIILQAIHVNQATGEIDRRPAARQGQLLCVRKPSVLMHSTDGKTSYSGVTEEQYAAIRQPNGNTYQGSERRLMCEQYLLDPGEFATKGRDRLHTVYSDLTKKMTDIKNEKEQRAHLSDMVVRIFGQQAVTSLINLVGNVAVPQQDVHIAVRGVLMTTLNSECAYNVAERQKAFVYLRVLLLAHVPSGDTKFKVTAALESAFDSGLLYMIEELDHHIVIGMIMSSYAKVGELVDVFIGHTG
jgi:hypothetical protein